MSWYRDLPIRGRLHEREPMAKHCSWRAGGVAERFFEPADVADLAVYLRAAPAEEALTWIGLGSNVLVRDGGLPGTVIATGEALSDLRWLDGEALCAGSGLPCAKVAKAIAKAALTGGEFLAGIPGTIGGSLAMNAGAFGREIWQCVVAVETIDRRGERRHRDAPEFKIGYRSVQGPPGEWFIGATLRFDRAGGDAAAMRIRSLLGERNATQPLGLASCGSVFKNPPGDFAGRLIEAAGMKGARIGGSFVSDKHANFIINDGTASATDIERLIALVQAAVYAQFGVRLETEVRIIGVAAAWRPETLRQGAGE